MIPRFFLFLPRGAVWLLLATQPLCSVGQPAATEPNPSAQTERDWVDNRWTRTQIGPFLASNLEFPGARVAKGLSIKVGDPDGGTMAYDTATCALRAGWLGGFLKPDAARYGLLRAPKFDGTLAFNFGVPRLPGQSNHFTGLHLNGNRVVLDYTLNGVRMLESPWLEIRDGIHLFTRTFEREPGSNPAKVVVAEAGTMVFTYNRAVIDLKLGVLVIVAEGNGILTNDGRSILLTMPPTNGRSRARVTMWSGDPVAQPKFDAVASTLPPMEDLQRLARPGPAHWLPELKTAGQVGPDTDFLAVDTLTVPYDNPWHALMFLSGVDFTPDGTVYVCTIHGDVWRVTGLDKNLGSLRWKRFATGLFQPLGLKVRGREIFVLGRDQITRLRDLNGDGEADYYENFCNLIDTSTGGHDYVTSLEKDNAGNFYFVDPRGAHRVSPDGRAMETLATGFRNPNGLGASPDGRIITITPQQGEWTPSSVIHEIKPGGYYGYGGPRITTERPLGYDAPLCWIPHGVDNSSGGEVWVPEKIWGPLGGQLLHLLWGRCGLMLVLRDVVDGVPQGAVVPLPGKFLSGPQRGTFNARDGNLYIAGSTGWQTSAVKDGALQRVRFTGSKPAILPVAWHAQKDGITLKFSQPLDRSTAEAPGSYGLHQWNYRYAAQYGSKDWSVTNPEKEGRDEVTVKSARLQPDGKSVFLEIPDLRPVMQMEIKYNLNTADAKVLRSQLWLTLNRLDSALR